MKLYQDSGYVNIRGILDLGLPFNFIVGGRATGKTYTSLLTMLEDKHNFMFMRRTQAQCDLINKPEFSPFKSIMYDHSEYHIGTQSITKYNAGFYHQVQNDDGEYIIAGDAIGYTAALSTISNIRGFDASNVEILIFDEFIPERHERPLKEEGAAFLNAYETINRNRELKGKKPLQVLCLANANTLTNAIFLELRLVSIAEKMQRKKQSTYINKERGTGIFMLQESPISTKKANTALYKLTTGSDFEGMALSNTFTETDQSGSITVKPIKEYRPLVTVGEITIYKHKSKREYYVSTLRSGSPAIYGTSPAEVRRLKVKCSWILDCFFSDLFVYESYLCYALLTKYIL